MSVIAGYEHYIENAQLIIALLTAIFFIHVYNKEATELASSGYSMKYLFFMVLFCNSFAVFVEKFLILTNNTEGTPPEVIWLFSFVLLILLSISFPLQRQFRK